MTRKDYVKIAAILARRHRLAALDFAASSIEGWAISETLDLVATDVADVFAEDNPRFDRARFEEACCP